jgi:hypothetical protein
MQIHSTSTVGTGPLKVLVYGNAGAGKTRLCATVPSALILSAEAGLLSLRDQEIDYAIISNMQDLQDAYLHLKKGEHSYEWVCLDSISEIAEQCLSAEKEKQKDPRKAYGELADRMFKTLRAFRDLPMSVYMSAKLSRVEDDGRQVYGPSLPGRQLEQGISYLFDEVFALQSARNDEGGITRWLLTQSDGAYIAKDRSGALDAEEPAHLGRVAKKIGGAS